MDPEAYATAFNTEQSGHYHKEPTAKSQHVQMSSVQGKRRRLGAWVPRTCWVTVPVLTSLGSALTQKHRVTQMANLAGYGGHRGQEPESQGEGPGRGATARGDMWDEGTGCGRLSLCLNLWIWKALSRSNISDSDSAGSRVDPVAGGNAACTFILGLDI